MGFYCKLAWKQEQKRIVANIRIRVKGHLLQLRYLPVDNIEGVLWEPSGQPLSDKADGLLR